MQYFFLHGAGRDNLPNGTGCHCEYTTKHTRSAHATASTHIRREAKGTPEGRGQANTSSDAPPASPQRHPACRQCHAAPSGDGELLDHGGDGLRGAKLAARPPAEPARWLGTVRARALGRAGAGHDAAAREPRAAGPALVCHGTANGPGAPPPRGGSHRVAEGGVASGRSWRWGEGRGAWCRCGKGGRTIAHFHHRPLHTIPHVEPCVLWWVLPRCVAFVRDVLCYAMLCYAMPCYAMLWLLPANCEHSERGAACSAPPRSTRASP